MAISAKGQCRQCERMMTKGGMTRHLKSCHGEGKRLLIAIAAPRGPWWMHIAASPQATLYGLDSLLRRTWLECCDHLSAFDIKGTTYDSSGQSYGWEPVQTMDQVLAGVLGPGDRFEHQYDFGSTTHLVGRVVGKIGGDGAPISILARNEPIPWTCGACGEPAKSICTSCGELTCGCKESCPECRQDFEDMSLPVANSPRMGVCGYWG